MKSPFLIKHFSIIAKILIFLLIIGHGFNIRHQYQHNGQFYQPKSVVENGFSASSAKLLNTKNHDSNSKNQPYHDCFICYLTQFLELAFGVAIISMLFFTAISLSFSHKHNQATLRFFLNFKYSRAPPQLV